MVIYEVEDMDIGESNLMEFQSEEEAHRIFVKKGFKTLGMFELYAGNSKENGHEISIMKPQTIPSSHLSSVN